MRSVIDFEAIVKNRTLVVGSPCRSSGGHSWDDVVDTSHDDLDISLKQGLIVVVFVGLHFSYLPIPRLPKPLEPSRCPSRCRARFAKEYRLWEEAERAWS